MMPEDWRWLILMPLLVFGFGISGAVIVSWIYPGIPGEVMGFIALPFGAAGLILANRWAYR